jgi:Zn finger protein HypA/HybF involved in hydrogenase expression
MTATKVKCKKCQYRLGHMLNYVNDLCPACGGTRTNGTGLPCRTCDGSGVVPVVLAFVCDECGGNGEVDVSTNEDETIGV